MRSNEIASRFSRAAKLIQEFVDGDLEQTDFCSRLEEVVAPLTIGSKQGVRGILGSYPSVKEKIRGLVHETLHDMVNRAVGVPSAGIRAITEDGTGLVWGATVMDTRAARATLDLRRKLRKAQRLHTLIEKLNI